MGKYFKYAIGEILLVVIGILIALQVNNWNEHRKDRNAEAVIVKTIYNELNQNLEYSTSIASQLEKRLSATTKLMEFTSNTEHSISAHTFDSLMIQTFLFPPYTPVKSDLERVLGSSQIELISNRDLEEQLSDYKTTINQATLSYKYAEDDFKLLILPYFVKHYPLKALLVQYGLNVKPTIHERNYKDLLSSLEFDNILAVIYADSGGQFANINESIKHLEGIKRLIEANYDTE